MIRFLKSLLLLPVAAVVILLAVVALGIIIGGIFTWLGQGRVRAYARHHRREATRYEREVNRLRPYAPDALGQTYPGTSVPVRTALPAPR